MAKKTTSDQNRIAYLEQVVAEKEDLILQLQEANRLSTESLEQLSRQLSDQSPELKVDEAVARPSVNSFSLAERLYLMAACLGVLKDPLTQGPLDPANFDSQCSTFIDQAEMLYLRLMDRILQDR